MHEADRKERARARRAMSGRMTRLDAAAASDPPVAASDPSQRIANCWALSVDAFLLSGKPWPSYDRTEAPGKIIRAAVHDVP